MHELGIAMQIVEIATSSIPDKMKNTQVESVNLKVGKLAAVIPQNLRFCFDIVAKDTLLSGAKLNIEEIPVVAKCKECNTKWTIEKPVFTCIKCKSGSLEIISGRELNVESIELAED